MAQVKKLGSQQFVKQISESDKEKFTDNAAQEKDDAA
jgi:hypothetical protein